MITGMFERITLTFERTAHSIAEQKNTSKKIVSSQTIFRPKSHSFAATKTI